MGGAYIIAALFQSRAGELVMLLESLVVCGLLLLVCGVYKFSYAPYQLLKSYGIKGPAPIPFFGNYREEARMTSLKYYEHLYQKYGPVAGFYVGQTPQILIADVDMLKQILVKDFNNFMDQPPLPEFLPKGPKALLLTGGETWKTNRRILSPTFSTSKMKMMTPLVKRNVETLVDICGEKAATGESFDFYKLYRLFAMEMILATAFGRAVDIQRGESDNLTETAYTISKLMGEGQLTSREMIYMIFSNFPWAVPLARFVFVHSAKGDLWRYMNKIALELVEARRSSANSGRKYKDMLQLMMDATGEEEDEDTERGEDCDAEKSSSQTMASDVPPSCKKSLSKLTDEQIVVEAVGLMMAGYDTTANALAYTSYLLALHPEIQEKLQSEIDSYFNDKPDASTYEASQEITYLDNVIQESLRLYPPAPRTFRFCLKTTVVKGVTIPQGATIVVPCLLLQRDPLYWKDPENFDPDRFTADERVKRPQLCHIPFGFGPRSCIGIRFALLVTKIALMELLKRYTFVRTPDTEVPPQLVLGVTMAPKNGIYLKVISRTD